MKHHDEPSSDHRDWLTGERQVWFGLHELVALQNLTFPCIALFAKLGTLCSVPRKTMAARPDLPP